MFKRKEKEIERMIDQYGNDILRISFMYLKDRQLAEDAFQEVFLKVFNKLDTFRHDSSEKTWLIQITINVCKDMMKKNWFKKVATYDQEILEVMSGSEDDLDELIENQELFQRVLTLPNKYKDVIILYYYQGFQIKEIASILDTTTGNVSSLLKRAREQLKDILTRGEEHEFKTSNG